ncbi:unnamed protein product [Euphydryas editha]|uniref:E3 ubiquitin-protein ligase DCST1-like C-terminal domain-containing protein n=1 Tax=Euphydryas editha TaxID=104508 RepID=A0AAU9UH33_EUPED|nr:unnamed protein product [Euphydryas editha]
MFCTDLSTFSCDTLKCPGVYCVRCFTDIGRLCTICLSPKDYGDMSDVSLEKGSSDESDNTDEEVDMKENKLKGTEKERLIKKSKPDKTNMQKMSYKQNNNENNQDTSLLPNNGKDGDRDKVYDNPIDLTKSIDVNMKTNVVEKQESEINTEFPTIKLSHESKCIDKDDKESVKLSSRKKLAKQLKCSKRSNNQRSVKKLKYNKKGQTLLNTKLNVRNPFFQHNLVNMRCVQFSQDYPFISSYKNKLKYRKKRSVSYKIGIIKHLRMQRRIKNKKIRKRKQKEIFTHNEKNKSDKIENLYNSIFTQSKNCKDTHNDNDTQINCKNIANNLNSDKANNDVKRFTKHKYTIKRSYQGIRRFLKFYSSYVNAISDSKKRCKLRKYKIETKIKFRRRNKKIVNDVDDNSGKNRRIKNYKKSYGIIAYLWHRLKVKFYELPLKNKLKSDLSIPLKENDNNRNINIQELLDYKNDFSNRTEDNFSDTEDLYEKKSEKSVITEAKNIKSNVANNLFVTEQKQENNNLNSTNTVISSELDESINNNVKSSSEVSESCSLTVSTFSLSYDTKDRTTLSKIVDFKDLTKQVETRSDKIKVKAESNKGKKRKKSLFLNARSLKNDWWSPIPDKRIQ